MKLYLLFTLLVLSSLLAYKAQGMRLITKTGLSTSNQYLHHQDIIKISLEKSSQDDHLLATTAEISSGTNRKLMTKVTSSSTATNVSKNQKTDGNFKHESKPEIKSTGHGQRKKDPSDLSSSENSNHWKKEFIPEQYPDVIDIAGMDYSPARKKSPIHN